MKSFLTSTWIGALLLLGLSVYAQPELIILDETQAPQAVYQIYLGKLQPGESLDGFADAAHLGFLRTFSIEEPPRVQGSSRASEEKKVFLGPFLGHETATKMMEQLVDLGYIEAYLERDEDGLKTPAGNPLTHSIQLGAFETLDMKKFSKIATVPAHGVFVLYEDGLYKVLSGLYPTTEKAYLRKSVLPYLKNTWGMSGFIRPIERESVQALNK